MTEIEKMKEYIQKYLYWKQITKIGLKTFIPHLTGGL